MHRDCRETLKEILHDTRVYARHANDIYDRICSNRKVANSNRSDGAERGEKQSAMLRVRERESAQTRAQSMKPKMVFRGVR